MNRIKSFISYTHDNNVHKESALLLANRLRSDGIDTSIDQYEYSPEEGWPRWMVNQIANADFVVVICSESYKLRFEHPEQNEIGLGAKWEGAVITQFIYDNNSLNQKYIPIVFKTEDLKHIPILLKSSSYYNLSDPNGYELLYRRITNQPRIIKPEIGELRKFPPNVESSIDFSNNYEQDTSILIFSATNVHLFQYSNLSHNNGIISTIIEIQSTMDSGILSEIQQTDRKRSILSYTNKAFVGEILKLTQNIENGKETWVIEFKPDDLRKAASYSDMGCPGYSDSDIATLRSRFILLNEEPPGWKDSDLDKIMLATLVRGVSVPLPVDKCFIPSFYEDHRENIKEFLTICKRWTTAQLILSAAVASIYRLEFTFADQKLYIDFSGKREKKYANQEAFKIEFAGFCRLD